MWSHSKFLEAFRRAADELTETVERKNADYSGFALDPFANFRLVETVFGGRLSAEDGIIVRITDKLARLATLATREPSVADESFADTAYDMAAYSIILALLRRSRTEPDEPPTPVTPDEPTEEQKTAFAQVRALIAAMRNGGAAAA